MKETFEEHAKTAISYAGFYIKAAQQWWNPQQIVPDNQLEKLRFYLESSGMQFKTKHSDSKIIIERICMMYNELINSDNRKYDKFVPQLGKSLQDTQIRPQQNKHQNSNQCSEFVSIAGELKVKSDKIKCNILITIVLHDDIENTLPIIYIRNPDAHKTQPNPQYISQQQVYQQILGGVTLSIKQRQSLSKQWKQYKSSNLLNLVKHIQNLLYQNFPFVKRFTPMINVEADSRELKTIQNYKQKLKYVLPKIQSLAIMKAAIESEYQYTIEQVNKQKQIMKDQKELSSQSIIRLFKIQENQELLEWVCIEKASLDCMRLIENQMGNKDNYYQSVQAMKEWAAKSFEARFKIQDIIQKLAANLGKTE